jgi:uncharacterized protein YdiU (UPF0061 family)
MQNLYTKEYKNEFVRSFKGDDTGSLTPRQTPGMLYSLANPTPVKKPVLLAWSDELARELEIPAPSSPEEVQILGGNLVTPSMNPYAACYAGHQFGNWAGQLGDGRAITLGEWVTSAGSSWEIQLKGAGRTAYSRTADGRAVLRSSLREYLMSEAMFYLGVPTTRALSLVSTGDQVYRDMFYNGNAQFEPGAIVTRVAPSFLRFGNFEILAARQEPENLQKLVDWTIEKFYPSIQGEDRVLEWFGEIVRRSAVMVVEWLRVGFVHGVMNTDNMSILGLTIDYGPFSFIDDYDPNFTPNTTDLPGRRYAFGRQPSVVKWNLGCLAGAIAPLFEDTDKLVAVLDGFDEIFWINYYDMMGRKTGLDEIKPEDPELFRSFEKTMTMLKADMTIFYQLLADVPGGFAQAQDAVDHFKESFYKEPSPAEAESLFELMRTYTERIGSNKGTREESLKRMRGANPRFIPRNYLLHQAIEQMEKGEDTLFLKLQHAIREPYSTDFDEFFVKRPDWATQKAGCSMLSCSS